MKSTDKSIWIEFRGPRNKEERDCYGLTESTDTTAKVFMNTGLRKTHFSDTFFHEMAHVFFSFMEHRVPKGKQEKLAQKIGVVCAEILR